ncbi:MAG: superinfection immunity protein [Acidimicrobiales bacterium]
MLHLASTTPSREYSATETAIAITIWLTIVIIMWLLPTIIAKRRGVANVGSIAVLNIFLGWLSAVWVICLALSCQSVADPPSRRRRQRDSAWFAVAPSPAAIPATGSTQRPLTARGAAHCLSRGLAAVGPVGWPRVATHGGELRRPHPAGHDPSVPTRMPPLAV